MLQPLIWTTEPLGSILRVQSIRIVSTAISVSRFNDGLLPFLDTGYFGHNSV